MKSQDLSYSMKLPVNRGNVSAGSAGGGRGRAAQRARVRQNEAARRGAAYWPGGGLVSVRVA